MKKKSQSKTLNGDRIVHHAVRVTAAENAKITRAAKKVDLSFNKFARFAALERAEFILSGRVKLVRSEGVGQLLADKPDAPHASMFAEQ